VELHGGTVTVESEGEGKGTTFRLRLPKHAGEAPVETPPVGRRPPAEVPVDQLERLTGVHVLIVEDDPDSRNVLTVLVSDIGMPEEDGYSLIRRVREINGSRLPAIALTAYARAQDAEAALGAGYDHHLPKPVAPADLIRAIKAVTRVSA
jgi:CheY-like chemotaxis protein